MGIIMHTNSIYIMLPLYQNTKYPEYQRIINNNNFPNNDCTCSYPQSTHIIVKIKLTPGFIVCSNPCVNLVLHLYGLNNIG